MASACSIRSGVMICLAVFALNTVGCGGGNRDRAVGRPVEQSTSGKQQALAQTLPVESPKNDLDMSLVSDLFLSVWVVHPQRILSSDVLSAAEFSTGLAQITNEMPLDLAASERITVLIPAAAQMNEAAMPVIRAEYSQPVDVEELLDKLDTETREATIKGKQVFQTAKPPMMVYQESPEVVVIGGIDLIPRLIGDDRPQSGRLAELLSQTELEKDIVAVMSGSTLESAMGMMSSMMPGGGGQGPPSIEAIYLYMDLDDNYLARLKIETDSVAQAEDMVVKMRAALGTMRMMLPAIMDQAADAGGGEETIQVTRFFRQMMEGIQVDAKDETVTVYFDRPDGLKQTLASMAVMAAREKKVLDRHENVKRVATAINDRLTRDGVFLPTDLAADQRDEEGLPLLSWRVYLLPELGHQELFDRFRLNEPWDSEHNRSLLADMPDVYRTTAAEDTTTILAIVGLETALSMERDVDLSTVTDPHPDTMILADVEESGAVPWTKPSDVELRDGEAQLKLGRSNEPFVIAGFLDGNVWRLPKDLKPEQWEALWTATGGEELTVRQLLGRGLNIPMRGGFSF